MDKPMNTSMQLVVLAGNNRKFFENAFALCDKLRTEGQDYISEETDA